MTHHGHTGVPRNLRELVSYQFVIFLPRRLPLLDGVGIVLGVAMPIVDFLVRSQAREFRHVEIGKLHVRQLQVVEMRRWPESDEDDNDTGQHSGHGHDGHDASSQQGPQAVDILGHHFWQNMDINERQESNMLLREVG